MKAQEPEQNDDADSTGEECELDAATAAAIVDGAVLAAGHSAAMPEALVREHEMQVRQQQLHMQYQFKRAAAAVS